MPMTVRHERENVYRVEVQGLLRSSEFEQCQGVLRAEIDRVGPVRLLFVLDAFEGWEPSDDWRDLSFYVTHGAAHRADRHRRRRAVEKRIADVRERGPAEGARGVLFAGADRRRALLAVGLNGHQRTSDEACQPSTIRSRPAGGPDPSPRSRRSAGRRRHGARPGGPEAGARGGGRDGRRRNGGRRRLATCLRSAERRHDPPVSAADRHLGQADAHGGLQRGLASSHRRREAGTGLDQARSRHQGGARRAPRQLPEPEDHRGQFQGAGQGARCGSRGADHQGLPERGAGDRARSHPRERRQEQHRAEDRRGDQSRSADDLLQQDAGGDRQPGRGAHLEPDQGERSASTP